MQLISSRIFQKEVCGVFEVCGVLYVFSEKNPINSWKHQFHWDLTCLPQDNPLRIKSSVTQFKTNDTVVLEWKPNSTYKHLNRSKEFTEWVNLLFLQEYQRNLSAEKSAETTFSQLLDKSRISWWS